MPDKVVANLYRAEIDPNGVLYLHFRTNTDEYTYKIHPTSVSKPDLESNSDPREPNG